MWDVGISVQAQALGGNKPVNEQLLVTHPGNQVAARLDPGILFRVVVHLCRVAKGRQVLVGFGIAAERLAEAAPVDSLPRIGVMVFGLHKGSQVLFETTRTLRNKQQNTETQRVFGE